MKYRIYVEKDPDVPGAEFFIPQERQFFLWIDINDLVYLSEESARKFLDLYSTGRCDRFGSEEQATRIINYP